MVDLTPEDAESGIPRSRREARRQSRRDAILEVAGRFFLQHGYSGTTMSGIALELGGSKGTLWSYYPSKEALFGAVLDRATSDFREQLTQSLSPDDPIAVALAKFCTRFLSKLSRPESLALHRLVVGEAARFPEMGRIFYERAPLKTQALLADFLRRAGEQGQIRCEDPLVAAQYLIALCTARSQQQLVTGVVDKLPSERIKAEVGDAVAVFLRAFAA
ncbi:MAG: TetR/AcrR family transcriptional regulator [Pseudomonadota bacterium]